MTTNSTELAQLRDEILNPAIGSSSHLRKLALSLVEALEKAQQRIDELESRTVKLPHRNLGHPKLFLLCPFPYYDAEDMEKALAAAGIKVEAE